VQVWEKNEWRQVSKEEAAVDDWILIFWKRSFIKQILVYAQKKQTTKKLDWKEKSVRVSRFRTTEFLNWLWDTYYLLWCAERASNQL
jgi:hypothetical protein